MALKILIVDDEEPARQGLVALLARCQYAPESVGDGLLTARINQNRRAVRLSPREVPCER